jgi:hypothetical protein
MGQKNDAEEKKFRRKSKVAEMSRPETLALSSKNRNDDLVYHLDQRRRPLVPHATIVAAGPGK